LRKSLYGLKQAARVWNKTLHDALVRNGCEQAHSDKCLYKFVQGKDVCYLLVHVDDILVATNVMTIARQLMKNIGSEFELKDLGNVKHYLGIDVRRDNQGHFLISQSKYIESIIEAAGLCEAKMSKFPLDTGYFKLDGKLLSSNEEYRKLIGMLLYLSTNTRPDIAASVSILSQKVTAPRNVDLNEVKRVIRFLKYTQNFKLILTRTGRKIAKIENQTVGSIFLSMEEQCLGVARNKTLFLFHRLKQNLLHFVTRSKK
jgi:hypothetical protein